MVWINTRVECEKLADGMEIAEDVLDSSGRVLLKAPQTVDRSLKKILCSRGVLSVVTRTWKEKESDELLLELRVEIAALCERHRYLKDDPRWMDSVKLFARAFELSKKTCLPLGESLCDER
jgi:hypothetical protein